MVYEPETSESESKYIYTSTVRKKYGLTPKMIQELGPPDRVVENPHYRRGVAYLYDSERVEVWAAQNRPRLDKANAQRANRSSAAKKAHERRREEERREQQEQERQLNAWVENAPVSLQPLPETLLADAWQTFRVTGGSQSLTPRQLIAHVRTKHSNFPDLVSGLRGNEWRYVLRGLLRTRVDSVIRQALREWLANRTDGPAFTL